MKQDTNRKITVEDLLSLKRAERPPVEFWASFDSELRAKQLAAIVAKRSLWDGLPRIFAAAGRHHLPFGAVAALALTWAGIHYAGGSLDGVHAVSLAPTARAVARVSVPAAPAAQAAGQPALPRVIQVAAPEAAPAPVAAAASRVSEATPAALPEAPARNQFSDVVAVTLADFRATQPELARREIFGSDREFETAVESMRQPAVEPLSRLDPVSDDRRSRLLAGGLPAYASSSPASYASERVRERVSNDRMYESMDPYESSNSRMSLEIRF